jgi:hypothetical protein
VDDDVVRSELEVAIEARKELGAELEPAVIDAFVERIEQRLVQSDEAKERALRKKREHQRRWCSARWGSRSR